MEILKVSAKSNPNSVAGALAGVLREKGGSRNSGNRCRRIKSGYQSYRNRKGFCCSGRNRSGVRSRIHRY